MVLRDVRLWFWCTLSVYRFYFVLVRVSVRVYVCMHFDLTKCERWPKPERNVHSLWKCLDLPFLFAATNVLHIACSGTGVQPTAAKALSWTITSIQIEQWFPLNLNTSAVISCCCCFEKILSTKTTTYWIHFGADRRHKIFILKKFLFQINDI